MIKKLKCASYYIVTIPLRHLMMNLVKDCGNVLIHVRFIVQYIFLQSLQPSFLLSLNNERCFLNLIPALIIVCINALFYVVNLDSYC